MCNQVGNKTRNGISFSKFKLLPGLIDCILVALEGEKTVFLLHYSQNSVLSLQDMADAASCSSSSEKYDVFLSFRGEDTRRNFISHLYNALCQKQIKTYKDDRTLKKGDVVWPAIARAINNSYFCIVVFSKHYAFSMWCLKELTQIIECKQEGEIIPVFYEIDPLHIRKQTGSYKEAFEKHEKESKFNEATVRKWKKFI